MSDRIHLLSISLAAVSCIFFVIGCAGFAKNETTLENAPWISYDSGETELYFGLRRVVGKLNSVHTTADYGSCSSEWCDPCRQDGRGAVGLVFLALIFSLVFIYKTMLLRKVHTTGGQIANVFLSFTAACTSLIGVGLFMGDCFYKVHSVDTPLFSAERLKWGPGSSVTILGMFFMWITSFLQIGLAAVDPGYVPPAVKPAATAGQSPPTPKE
jgi:NADH:ubiquinone oxidoreductase subunit K